VYDGARELGKDCVTRREIRTRSRGLGWKQFGHAMSYLVRAGAFERVTEGRYRIAARLPTPHP